MKTRFAPSPTGLMHLGNIRAALLSYVWSLKHGAEFILRIDDTDRERSDEKFIKYIKEDLCWLGIKWNSCFKQSERSLLYTEVMHKCIEKGIVYDVYETQEELEKIRKDLATQKLPPAYKKSESRKIATKEDRYWRFDIGKSRIGFKDKIRGDIEIDLSGTSDPVICKANGDFTYIFASVVDDLESKISTIIRASDHISNTCTQLAIIRKILQNNILSGEEPEFAHYPLFMHESKQKMSKRNKSMSIDEFKSMHPLAINHFLYSVGNKQKLSVQKNLFELAKLFDFSDYSKSNAVEFSEKQLFSWQKKLIPALNPSEISAWTGVSFKEEEWEIIKGSIEEQKDIFYWHEVLREKKSFCLFISKPNFEYSIDSIDQDKVKMLQLRQILTGRNFGPKLELLLKIIPQDIIDFRLQNYKDIQLYLTNSLSKHKDKFEPIDPLKVRMYACGPTLYDSPHIGNGRSFVVFDLLYRLLMFEYRNVSYSRNITDIDDKIINRAKEMNITPIELVEMVYQEFKLQMKELNVLQPNNEPRVTTFLPEIISCIQKMLDSGYAYLAQDGIYFSISKVKEYNLFSISGESQTDFVLWKFRGQDEIGWDSPWGWGRPGWHIECTAMSQKTLGLPFDLHCGGMDLIFPHHTNECAQSCGLGFESTANYWIHNNFINVDNLKMSKSLNNSTRLDEIKQHPMVIRVALLSSHYRQQLPWSDELLKEASVLYNKWRRQLGNLLLKNRTKYTSDKSKLIINSTKEILEDINQKQDDAPKNILSGIKMSIDESFHKVVSAVNENNQNIDSLQKCPIQNSDQELREDTDVYRSINITKAGYPLVSFLEALNNDLNTPLALKILDAAIGKENTADILYSFELIGIQFDFSYLNDRYIADLIKDRQIARKNKDFIGADLIKEKLFSIGIELQESKDEVTWYLPV